MHFQNLEVRRWLRRPSVSAWRCRLISSEGDRPSDIGIEVDRHTIDQVRDAFLIHELVFVRLAGAGQATGNFAVSFWFRRLTKSEDWRNY